MTYRERREARADRLDEWAAKREARAAADLERAHDLASVIPLGQPILAGHYSQGRDTRYRARIDSTMRRGVEHANKARDMASRAEGIRGQLDRSIYSDDVDAVDRLRERVAELEAERDRVKAFNAACRRGAPDWSILTPAEVDHHRRTLEVAGWQCKGGAFPAYHLSNLSGNIKRNRDRLAELERVAERQAATAEAGGLLVEDLAGGYCRVTFDEKPERATIDALKAAGFRWGRGSWVGQRDALPPEVADDHGVGCDGPGNCVCSTEPEGLIGCEVEGCRARFFLVESRQFPRLCIEHSDDASRAVDGWTPGNSRD